MKANDTGRLCKAFIIIAVLAVFLVSSVNAELSVADGTTPEPDVEKGSDGVWRVFMNGQNVTISEPGDKVGTLEPSGYTPSSRAAILDWTTGTLIVDENTRIYGGSYKKDVTVESGKGKITFNGGSVGTIFGGGYSADPTIRADVNTQNKNIEIILSGKSKNLEVYAGGEGYSSITGKNGTKIITMNSTLKTIYGGGWSDQDENEVSKFTLAPRKVSGADADVEINSLYLGGRGESCVNDVSVSTSPKMRLSNLYLNGEYGSTKSQNNMNWSGNIENVILEGQGQVRFSKLVSFDKADVTGIRIGGSGLDYSYLSVKEGTPLEIELPSGQFEMGICGAKITNLEGEVDSTSLLVLENCEDATGNEQRISNRGTVLINGEGWGRFQASEGGRTYSVKKMSAYQETGYNASGEAYLYTDADSNGEFVIRYSNLLPSGLFCYFNGSDGSHRVTVPPSLNSDIMKAANAFNINAKNGTICYGTYQRGNASGVGSTFVFENDQSGSSILLKEGSGTEIAAEIWITQRMNLQEQTAMNSVKYTKIWTEVDSYGNTISDDKKTLIAVNGSINELTADMLAGIERIGNGAAIGNTNLGKIVMPDSVKSIGNDAFYGCTSLTDVTFSANLESIGGRAFSRTAITELSIGDGGSASKLSQIMYLAFAQTKLNRVSIYASGSLEVDKSAFSNIQSGNMTVLISCQKGVFGSEDVFSGCSGLSSVQLKGEWTLNGTGYFSRCEKLTSLEIEKVTNEKIQSIFAGCKEGSIILTVSDNVKTFFIKDYKYLKEINSNSIKTVESLIYHTDGQGGSLMYVVPCNEVVVPADITEVQAGAFDDCQSLEKVIWNSSADIPADLFIKCSSLNEFEFGNGSRVKSIGSNAFTNAKIIRISLPSSVETIGVNAFKNCIYLTDVDFGANASLKEMPVSGEGSAFLYCRAIERISITGNDKYSTPDSTMIVESDGDEKILRMVTGRTTGIVVPADVTSFDATALQDAFSLRKIGVEQGNKVFASEGDMLLTRAKDVLVAVPNLMSEIKIPSTVVEAGWRVTTGKPSYIASSTNGGSPFDYVVSISLIEWKNDSSIALKSSRILGVDYEGIVSKVDIATGHLQVYSNWFQGITIGTLQIQCQTYTGGVFIWNSSIDSIELAIFGDVDANSGVINSLQSYSEISVECKEDLDLVSIFGDSRIPVKYDGDEIAIRVNGSCLTLERLLGYSLAIEQTQSDEDEAVFGLSVEYVKPKWTGESVVWFDIIKDGMESSNFLAYVNGQQLNRNASDKLYELTLTEDTKVSVEIDPQSKVNVSFYNDSSLIKTLELYKGQIVESESVPLAIKENHTFTGWYLDSGFVKKWNASLGVGADLNIYARFVKTPEDAVIVSFSDAHGNLTVTYVSGNETVAVYNGDPLERGIELSVSFEPMTGFEFIGWNINGDLSSDGMKTVKATDDITIGVVLRNYSTSSGIIGITDLPTVAFDSSFNLKWKHQFELDTSGTIWTGMPGTPLIIDGYAYVRQNTSILKIKLDSDQYEEVAKAATSLVVAYYQHLGYGGDGRVIDYSTGKVFDSDLNEIYTISEKITVATYKGGFIYAMSDGHLLKYNAQSGKRVIEGNWSEGPECRWFGLYGAVSTPVIVGNSLYVVEADGDSRGIGCIDLDTGVRSYFEVGSIRGMYLDDGWLSHYNYGGIDYLFITAYGAGLFDNDSVLSDASVVASVQLKKEGGFEDGSERFFYAFMKGTDGKYQKNNAATSAVQVFNDRGYVHIGGLLYVLDISEYLDDAYGNNGQWATAIASSNIDSIAEYCYSFVHYVEQDVYSHSGIVISTYDYDSTGKVYIYTNPYPGSQQLIRVFCDYEGKTEPTGYKATRETGSFGSQIIRVGPNGEMVLYSDDATLYCFQDVRMADYSFLIHTSSRDSEGNVIYNAEWVSAKGTDLQDALQNALKKANIAYDASSGSTLIDGKAVHYFMYTNEWFPLPSSGYAGVRDFFVSTIVSDLEYVPDCKYKALGEDKIVSYTLGEILNDKSISGRLTSQNLVTVSYDPNGGEIAEGELPVEAYAKGSTITLPTVEEVKAKIIRDKYTLVGLYLGGIDVSGQEIVLNGDVVIEAKWAWAEQSTRIAGAELSTDDPRIAELIRYDGSGYAPTKDTATNAIKAIHSGFSQTDVADKTLFLVFTQNGTSGKTIIGELYCAGRLIYAEDLESTNRVWYITIGDGQNYNKSWGTNGVLSVGDVKQFVMQITVDGTVALKASIDISSATDSAVSGTCMARSYAIGTDSAFNEGDSMDLTPVFYVSSNGRLVKGPVSQSGIDWTSSNESVAFVKDGKVLAVSKGEAVITGTTKDGGYVIGCFVKVSAVPISGVSIVSEESGEIEIGNTRQLNISCETGAVSSVEWTSSNKNVAIVDQNGLVKAISSGKAIITAKVTGNEGSASVDEEIVVADVLVNTIALQSSLTLEINRSVKLSAVATPNDATDKTLVWSVISGSSVSVDQNGNVTALSEGTSKIQVSAAGNPSVTATCTVTVVDYSVKSIDMTSSAKLEVGKTATLKAEVSPSNAKNKSVTWTSSNPAVATVSSGVVTAVSAGTAIITATSSANSSVTATCVVTVTDSLSQVKSVTLDKTSLAMEVNSKVTVTAAIDPEVTGAELVWTVSNGTGSVSVVKNSDGTATVTAKSTGSASLIVTVKGTQVSATCDITIASTETKVVSEETKKNDDGTTTDTKIEEIDTGKGSTTTKTTETVKDTDGNVKGSTSTYEFTSDDPAIKTKTTVTVTKDANGNVGQPKVEVDMGNTGSSSNGTRSITVNADDLKEAIKQLDRAKVVTGIDDLDKNIEILADEGKDVDQMVTTLDATSISDLSASDGVSLSISSEMGRMQIGNEVFTSMKEQGGKATLSVKKSEDQTSVPEALSKIVQKTLYEVDLTVGGKSVHQLNGKVTLSLPFALSDGQDPSKVGVRYVDADGNLSSETFRATYADGMVSFTTTHFSTFAVVYGDVAADSGKDTTTTVSGDGSLMTSLCIVLAALTGAFAATTVMFVLRTKGKI